MYEFWFYDLDVTVTGTTSDFLEVICQISEKFDSQTAGRFTEALMDDKKNERQFLRIEKWEFEFSPNLVSRPDEPEKRITLHKVR